MHVNPVTQYSSPYHHEQELLALMSLMPSNKRLSDMKKLRSNDPDQFLGCFYSLNLKLNGFDINKVSLVLKKDNPETIIFVS